MPPELAPPRECSGTVGPSEDWSRTHPGPSNAIWNVSPPHEGLERDVRAGGARHPAAGSPKRRSDSHNRRRSVPQVGASGGPAYNVPFSRGPAGKASHSLIRPFSALQEVLAHPSSEERDENLNSRSSSRSAFRSSHGRSRTP